METYEVPDDIDDLFKQGENSYKIIDYTPGFDMDNIQSMIYFLDFIEVPAENIETDDGTQVVLKHPGYNYKLVIDSGGLGDFFSHGFDVTILKGE